MRRRLLLTYLTITAVVLALTAVPFGVVFARIQRTELEREVEHDATAMAAQVEDALEQAKPIRPGRMLETLHARWTGRVTIVDSQGVCVAESPDHRSLGEDYSGRAGFKATLTGRHAAGTVLGGNALSYVAVPVTSGGDVHGAVKITYRTTTVNDRIRHMWTLLALLSIGVMVSVAMAGYLLASGITRPLNQVKDATERIAQGDLTARAPQNNGPPELRRLATTFNHTATRLQRLVESQRRFVGDAAHQLRTPLAALQLRIENLQPHLPADQRTKLDLALTEVHRLARLVDGMLALAGTEGNPLPHQPQDLGTAVERRLNAWQDAAEAKSVMLTSDIKAGSLVRVLPGALEDILDNLLSNALAAAPPGSAIRVEAAADNGRVHLHVIDAGPGLGADQRLHAFERFWRADTTRGGSGLGLAIVRQLAQASGGDASLNPGPHGAGTDVIVELPLAPGPVARVRNANSS